MTLKLFHIFLLSIFTVEVYCGESGLGWIKKKLPSFKHNWGKLSEKQIREFKESFGPSTNVDRFLLALDRRNAELSGIKQTEKEKADWNEKMQQIKKHNRSPRLPGEKKSIDQVNSEAGIAGSLYDGDIQLTDEQVDIFLGKYVDDVDIEARNKRQAYLLVPGYTKSYPANIWGTTLYYFFDPAFPTDREETARLAIEFWQNVTCINFVESDTAPNRVRVWDGIGCKSSIGMVGGVQDLSLADGCNSFATAAHEFGHALGFFHMMGRYDRNDSIIVNRDNAKNESRSNFDEKTKENNHNFGMPYEYGSVMQYSETAFSMDPANLKTILAKATKFQDNMGSEQVAFYDISMMNELYQCKQLCTSGATCVNGGFRNSRNCNTCICPSGWGGPTCADRPPGCGATLTATTTVQTQNSSIGVANAGTGLLFETCNYLIQASAGNKVKLTITALTSNYCDAGCTGKSIEVKAISDHRYTGIRHCCANDTGTTIISEGHIMPVIINNRHGKSDYTFTYSSVSGSTASTVKMSEIAYTSATYDSPTNPSTTTTTTPTTTKKTCVDKAGCPDWIANENFCDPAVWSYGMRMANCPNACNLCFDTTRNTQIWTATTGKVTTTSTTATKTTTTTKATTKTTTTTQKTTTTSLSACQRCTQSMDTYNEEYFSDKLGTPTFSYRFDSSNGNCLIADWFCRVDDPFTTANFFLYTDSSNNYSDLIYDYSEYEINALGFNDTTSRTDYAPFVCDSDGQWSFGGVTDFVFNCFADE